MARRKRKRELLQKSIADRKGLIRQKRLSFGFFKYTMTALHRAGLTDGSFVAARHNGTIGKVLFLGGDGRSCGVRPQARLSDRNKVMLQQRLDRLTRHLGYDFGTIVVDLDDDYIGPVYFTESVFDWEENDARNFG